MGKIRFFIKDPVATDQEIIRSLTDFIVNEVAPTRPDKAPSPDDPIVESGLVDSLGLFKVIGFIEDKFGVVVAPEEILLENFATVNAITRLVQGKKPA
jgi:acyl carrier protein